MADNYRCKLILAILLTSLVTLPESKAVSMDSGPVKPSSPLVSFLERVQEAAFKALGKDSDFDPKTYMDLPLRSSLSGTEEAFNKVAGGDLKSFIERYFDGAGDDLDYFVPDDFVAEPEDFLPKVRHPEVRAWALKVHSLWKNLSRKVSANVKTQPHLHTLLPLPASFIIPGSRFREVYYWDSYWVIRGLLVSKMYKTATAIVTNLISFIKEYGFVLNGARAYYTNRSQPPLLSAMIYEIYKRTGDIELVKISLPALQKEYDFWNSEIHRVTIQDAQASTHTLNRYYAVWNKPRPESLVIVCISLISIVALNEMAGVVTCVNSTPQDKASASKLLNASAKQQFYRELASTAESGWDFSTRWMRVPSDFTTLSTTSVIPVDLNAFILGMELNIAFFAKVVGETGTAENFLQASKVRKKAMESVFWNSNKKQWLDYWVSDGKCKEAEIWDAQNQNPNVFASNFIPLWMEPFYSDASLVDRVVDSLKTCGLLRSAGIATSLTDSGQQWDYPNGWAPVQHMIVEGMVRSDSKEARSLAEEIAVRWIRTNYQVYKKTGVMHEKYDVEQCGQFGVGGEYVPQTGFGWSNGVVLAFLEEFGWPHDRNIDC